MQLLRLLAPVDDPAVPRPLDVLLHPGQGGRWKRGPGTGAGYWCSSTWQLSLRGRGEADRWGCGLGGRGDVVEVVARGLSGEHRGHERGREDEAVERVVDEDDHGAAAED